ncbi:MAG: 30S ribosomal protein S11 [Fibrobacterota bacterium]
MATKKTKKKVPASGIVNIRATFNNTVVNVSDRDGNVIAWSTPGKTGFKGSRKSTSFAARVASEEVSESAFYKGMKSVEIHVRGVGNGREGAIKAVAAAGLKVTAIKDFTAVPHNGCRPPKKRRV